MKRTFAVMLIVLIVVAALFTFEFMEHSAVVRMRVLPITISFNVPDYGGFVVAVSWRYHTLAFGSNGIQVFGG